MSENVHNLINVLITSILLFLCQINVIFDWTLRQYYNKENGSRKDLKTPILEKFQTF